jgi:hypothetical protein
VGWQRVVDVDVDVVAATVDVLVGFVLVEAPVVGVMTGVDPQSGGVGATLDLHVVVAAVCFAAQAERQSLPALRLGQAALQLLSCEPRAFLQGLGQRPASTVELRKRPITIAMARRTAIPPGRHLSWWLGSQYATAARRVQPKVVAGLSTILRTLRPSCGCAWRRPPG